MQKIAPCNGVFLCVIHKHHLPRAVQKRHAAPHAGQGRSGRVLCQPLHRAAQQSVRYMQALRQAPCGICGKAVAHHRVPQAGFVYARQRRAPVVQKSGVIIQRNIRRAVPRACRAQTAVKNERGKPCRRHRVSRRFQKTPAVVAALQRVFGGAQHVQLLRRKPGRFLYFIRRVFRKNTGEFLRLLPHGRAVQQLQKTQLQHLCAQRIAGVEAFTECPQILMGQARDQVDVHVHIPHCNQTPDVLL